ncbi:hypothetical protein [Kribbella sp. CA-293567]|uniref:hypothetical protein n=1 Tax=Kribbella sp. CA-293567 TaxID=3002436 RepID=UPI0022DD3718|nr:hypothetical protein [Kribbella sp. CA-293567]WBQ04821.1 hypothetical protein OX958_33290 [Kribbella sp. CA-293567]
MTRSAVKAPTYSDPILLLEAGNWRHAFGQLRQGNLYDARLGADLRTVARAMGYRAAGNHSKAWTTLAVAAKSLRDRQRNLPVLPFRNSEVVQLALPLRPEPGHPAQAAFRTIQLICREQGELRLLRRRAGDCPEGLTEDQHILVLATVEYLTWVDADPGTWQPQTPPDEEGAAVEDRISEFIDRRREALLRSATDVRRLSRPTAGEMTRAVWDRAGQYRGLRGLALTELSQRGRPAWVEPALADLLPARVWALNAWMAAQALQNSEAFTWSLRGNG